MIKVSISSPQEKMELPFQQLRTAVTTVLEGEKVGNAKIVLAFVEDQTIARLNMQFLQHEGPTDVLTFPYSGKKSKLLEGEIVIGVEVAMREAAERGHAVENELILYSIHGALHLCGYDDHDDEEQILMRQKEREYLKKLSLPDITSTEE
ncbi:MAG: rRNA maturation RNase YbeY [Zavarzinella sp.]